MFRDTATPAHLRRSATTPVIKSASSHGCTREQHRSSERAGFSNNLDPNHGSYSISCRLLSDAGTPELASHAPCMHARYLCDFDYTESRDSSSARRRDHGRAKFCTRTSPTRPATASTSTQSDLQFFNDPSCINKLYDYITKENLRRAHTYELTTTSIVHTPCRCGTRCNHHRLLRQVTASTFHRREGRRLQAMHHRRHTTVTQSPTLHRQGLHQRRLYQHLHQHTAAASSTRWAPSVL